MTEKEKALIERKKKNDKRKRMLSAVSKKVNEKSFDLVQKNVKINKDTLDTLERNLSIIKQYEQSNTQHLNTNHTQKPNLYKSNTNEHTTRPLSIDVVDSNPYSRLMALKRMGRVSNYEKIREKCVAIVGIGGIGAVSVSDFMYSDFTFIIIIFIVGRNVGSMWDREINSL